MSATPYAKVLMTINGGSLVSGGQDVPSAATIQLDAESRVNWESQQWEIYEYPDGFACPAGWTSVNGIYVNSDSTPPSFTVSAAATRWGKYLFRLTVNNGLDDGVYHGPDHERPLVDQKCGVHVLSPNYSLRDIGFRETNQWDPLRLWIGELKRTLRIFDAVVGSVGSGVPGGSNNQVQYKLGVGTFGGAAAVEIQSGQLVVGADLGNVSTVGSIRSRAGAEWTARDIANTKTAGVVGLTDDGAGVLDARVGTYGDGVFAKTANRSSLHAQEYIYFRINSAVTPFQIAKIGTVYASVVTQNSNFALLGTLASVSQADFGGGTGVVFWGAASAVPATNPPANSLLFYVEGNVLKYRKPNGSIVVLDGTGGSGGSGVGYDPAALVQADWYINSLTGSDTNDGSIGSPLATFAELRKRIGNGKIEPPVDGSSLAREFRIHIPAAGLPESDGITFDWMTGEDVVPRIIADSIESTMLSGTFSAVQTGNPTTNAKWTVTHASLGATHVGKRIRIPSGPRAGTTMYVLANLGSGQVWVSPPSLAEQANPVNDPGAFSYVGVVDQTPQVGDAFVVEALSKISIGSMSTEPFPMSSGGGGYQPMVTIENLEVRDGNTYGGFVHSSTRGFIAAYNSIFRSYFEVNDGEVHLSNCLVARGVIAGGGRFYAYGGCMNLNAARTIPTNIPFGLCANGAICELFNDVHFVDSGIKGDKVLINRAAVWNVVSGSIDPGGHGVFPGGYAAGENYGGHIRLTATHMGGDSARLWGSGNFGNGVAVHKGCSFIADSGVTPKITGTGGDLLHHDAYLAWSHASVASLLKPTEATIVAKRVFHDSSVTVDVNGVGLQQWGPTGTAIGVPRLGVPGDATYDGTQMFDSPFSSEGHVSFSIFAAGGTHVTISSSYYTRSFLAMTSATGIRNVYFFVPDQYDKAYCKTLYNAGDYPIVVCVNDAQPSALHTDVLLPGEVAEFWFSPDGAYRSGANIKEIATTNATPVYVVLATLAVGAVKEVDVIVTISKSDGTVRQSFKLSGLFYGAAGPTATLDGGSLTDSSPRGTGTADARLDLSGGNVRLKITGIAATNLTTKFDASVV